MDKEKVFKYVKEHKKEILIGTGLAVGGCVLCALGVKKHSINTNDHDELGMKILDSFKGFEDVDIDLGIGEHQALSRKVSDNWFGATITGLLPKDLGELGDKLTKVPEIANDTKLSIIISTDDLSK